MQKALCKVSVFYIFMGECPPIDGHSGVIDFIEKTQ